MSIAVPFGKNQSKKKSLEGVGEKLQNEGKQKLESEKVRHRVSAVRGTSTSENDITHQVQDENSGLESVTRVPAQCVVVVVSLVALWLPTALVLNDGVALSAGMMVLQQSLIVATLYSSQGTVEYCGIFCVKVSM